MKKLLSILAICTLATTSILLSPLLINNNPNNNIVLKAETKKEKDKDKDKDKKEEKKEEHKKLASLIKEKKIGSFDRKPTISEIIKRVNEINKLDKDKLKESDVDVKIDKYTATINLKSDKLDKVVVKYKNTHKIAEIIGGSLAGVVVLLGAGFFSYKIIKKQKATKKQEEQTKRED
ncbi:hypothetical protein [Mycoplasma feriruminatoris]|uniref:ESAT-6 secretion machinery protein EssA n=1 Tax=Mycoplasma feriruminatoris TaxID=1179777 RepID=A0AAX3TFI8_9MOLU|nr:hypothetical protein [Mycoplasma feriruminatoris]WFQ92475.1 hypothetical protein MFERI14822_00250 [Mycoplasma feriruminatoris]